VTVIRGGEQLLLRSCRQRLDVGGEGDVVGCGGGLESEEDVERAPVVLMTPVGFSPKGKVRWTVGGRSGS
jgi:hypothetical protein